MIGVCHIPWNTSGEQQTVTQSPEIVTISHQLSSFITISPGSIFLDTYLFLRKARDACLFMLSTLERDQTQPLQFVVQSGRYWSACIVWSRVLLINSKDHNANWKHSTSYYWKCLAFVCLWRIHLGLIFQSIGDISSSFACLFLCQCQLEYLQPNIVNCTFIFPLFSNASAMDSDLKLQMNFHLHFSLSMKMQSK